MGKSGLFSTLDLLPEFGRRLRHHWAAAIMGGTVLGIVLFVWSLLGSVPHWAVGLILVGALLFASYFTWRDEHLALLRHADRVHAYVKGTIGAIRSFGASGSYQWAFADLKVSVLNAGPPTIIDSWTLDSPIAGQIPMRERNLDDEPLTSDERLALANVLELRHTPLATGGRRELLLKFVLKDMTHVETNWEEHPDIQRLWKTNEDRNWCLHFRDVTGATYSVLLIKNGIDITSVAHDNSTDLTPARHLV